MSAAVAIAFGLHVPNADWMPVATLVAMKPSLEQSAPVAEQRVAGTIIGAAAAALFLLTITGKTAVEVAIVVLGALAGAIRTVNYAFCTAAVAGAVLIAMDLPHRSNLADEERRSSSPSSAWASPSSSCSSPTGSASTPPKRHHRRPDHPAALRAPQLADGRAACPSPATK